MSGAVIDTLRAGYDAFNRGDWEAVFQAAPPDFELVTADRVINAGTYRGRDEIKRFFEDLFEPFDEVVIEAEQLIENGDLIVVLVRVRSDPVEAARWWTTGSHTSGRCRTARSSACRSSRREPRRSKPPA